MHPKHCRPRASSAHNSTRNNNNNNNSSKDSIRVISIVIILTIIIVIIKTIVNVKVIQVVGLPSGDLRKGTQRWHETQDYFEALPHRNASTCTVFRMLRALGCRDREYGMRLRTSSFKRNRFWGAEFAILVFLSEEIWILLAVMQV